MDKEKIDEFLGIVMNGDRINSKRLNRKYFEGIGKADLFDSFMNSTSHSVKSLRDKVNLARMGFVESYPKCKVCGRECILIGRKLSEYCSKECSLKDPSRKDKIKESKKRENKALSNERRKRTMLERYGAECNSQRSDIHSIWTSRRVSENIRVKLSDKAWLEREYVETGRSASEISEELGCDYSVVLSALRSFGFEIRHSCNHSSCELEVVSWLKSLGVECVNGYRGAYSDNREIDIFIPSKNVGIEINGLYWHTDKFRDRNYHRMKKDDLNGIRLIQITDLQWKTKRPICESIILNAIGMSSPINARECVLETYEHSTKDIREFFESNHMSGFVAGSFYAVLRHGNDIACGMILGKSRFHKDGRTELLRYVCKRNTNVRGGFSRLFHAYRKEHHEDVFSYVNLDLFDASMYRRNPSWKCVGRTDHGYFWTDGDNVVSRYKAMKKNLKSWFPNYDGSMTEAENMTRNGFHRYYDCGSMIFVNVI